MPKISDAKLRIEKLYPELAAEERAEVEENLSLYLDVVRTIYEQISTDNPKILTELRRRARLRTGKRALK